jgi:hypothetical protein
MMAGTHVTTVQLLEYNQADFFADLPTDVGMDEVGFIYVPTACQNGTVGEFRCPLL